MKTYTATYQLESPKTQKIWVPQFSDYKIGIAVTRGGEDAEGTLVVKDGSTTLSADAEKTSIWTTYTLKSQAPGYSELSIEWKDAEVSSNTAVFKLIRVVTDSSTLETGGEGGGGSAGEITPGANLSAQGMTVGMKDSISAQSISASSIDIHRRYTAGNTFNPANGGNLLVGSQLSAMGFYSAVIGTGCQSNSNTFAAGVYTKAVNNAEAAFGVLNESHTDENSSPASTTRFSVGIGDPVNPDLTRKNAVEVMENGDIYVNRFGGYDGSNIERALTLQSMLGHPVVLSGIYEDDSTFAISVYGVPELPVDYFKIKSSGVTVKVYNNNQPADCLEYSTDSGATWQSLDPSYDSAVEINGKVWFRNNGTGSAVNTLQFIDADSNGTEGPDVTVYGNIMTLIDPTGKSTTLSGNEFKYMFSDGNDAKLNVVDAGSLELPATTLASNCYQNMFTGCSNLTSAPYLPATTLADGCYFRMFAGCTSLNKLSVEFSDWGSDNETNNWLLNVAENGEFCCKTILGNNTTIARGPSNCPDGWTVVLMDPDEDNDADGLTNQEEEQYGTDPNKYDTDEDGYSDGEEVSQGTDPNDPSSYPGSFDDGGGGGV